MLKYEPGCLARSLAGRDRGRLYIILEAADEYVALTDGNTRQTRRSGISWKRKRLPVKEGINKCRKQM